MMGHRKRRPGRPNPVRGMMGWNLDALEPRVLMTLPPGTYTPYNIHDHEPVAVDLQGPPISVPHPLGVGQATVATLDNQGKVLHGTDREGDEWTITVHGPGYAIVTDATATDGVLDDDLDTIRIVGSTFATKVEGQTTASSRGVISDGVVFFNHLIDESPVGSIVLNGFSLAPTVPPPTDVNANSGVEVYLPQGVQLLQFHDIQAPIDLATNVEPIDIVIGQPNSPLQVKPTIRLDSIFNTVFDSTVPFIQNGIPETTPTVNILVNGEIEGIEMISSTATPIPSAGFQLALPTVSTTGRTAIRATAINHLKFVGTARNVTASREAVPFSSSFSGLDHLGKATFGGNADAVGLDVSGPVGSVRFLRGLGNPAGALGGATNYGLPDSQRGYPSFGFYGGLIKATRIRNIEAGAANTVLLTSQDPTLIQARRTGSVDYTPVAGNALTNVAVVSSGSIGQTHIVGNSQSSEIKSGFDYPSYIAGLEGTRARSRIERLKQRGDLIDSVVSATYRPVDSIYGNSDDVAGPGSIRGQFLGKLYTTGSQTALANTGVGFFARRKSRGLPAGPA